MKNSDHKHWERTGFRYYYLGSVCLNIYMLAGWWASLGIHISLVPLYVDFHILWFVISIMSKSRGEWLHEYDKEA